MSGSSLTPYAFTSYDFSLGSGLATSFKFSAASGESLSQNSKNIDIYPDVSTDPAAFVLDTSATPWLTHTPQRVWRPVEQTASTTISIAFFAHLKSDVGESFVAPADMVVQTLYEETRKLLSSAIRKCATILEETDLSDDESRKEAKTRICDIFDIFADRSSDVLGSLASSYSDRPDLIGFLLSEVFIETDSVAPSIKVSTIARYVNADRSSVRYAAVRALDLVNDAAAIDALMRLKKDEVNKDIQRLVDISLERIRQSSVPEPIR